MGKTLKIKAGDSAVNEFRFTVNGVAYDITGMTVKYAIKKQLGDSDADAIYLAEISSGDLTDPTNGITTDTIAADDTANFENPLDCFWQARLINGDIVLSTDVGICIIEQNLIDNE